ncbi:MAG TPA: ABC transporter permease [Terrimesophilobacter sp.]|nr:ABC transporter permease [Terrimesophilobacter sp.]HRP99845.1 ABC transporter permease [Terrimesophilobacter sp.]
MILIRSVHAELRKLFSTRMWWVLALILLGYVAFTASVLAAVFGGLGEQLASAGQPMPSDDIAPVIYAVASTIGYVFPVLLGALVTTAEFRHQTLTPTFLATPKRRYVLAAKALVMLVGGALFGVIGLLGSIGPGAPILSLTGLDAELASADTWALAGRVVVAMALWAVIGVGLGALIPSQVAAIVVVVAFTQFVEPILRMAPAVAEWTGDIIKFLPGAASDALVGTSFYSALTVGPGGASTSLEWWQGGLVLAGIAAILLIAGAITTWRKDVT